MDRYQLFRKIMDNLAEDCVILEATMCNYLGEIEIKGVCPGWVIRVSIDPAKEDSENA